MANNHICVESCFSSRTSDKSALCCYVCQKKFNSKCFNLLGHVKMLTSASNVLFMCYKCIERVNGIKQNFRRSNVTNSTTIPVNVIETPAARSDDSVSLSNMLSILTKLVDDVTRLNVSNDEIKQSIFKTNNNNLSVLNDAFPANALLEGSPLSSDNSSLNFLINKIDSLIDAKLSRFGNSLLSCEQVDEIVKKHSQPTESFDRVVGGSRINNPLDWSLSSPHHRQRNGSEDLFSMLHSFEVNTWSSFDSISRSVKDISEMLNKLFSNSACVPDSTVISSSNRSALVESIHNENRLELIHHDLINLTESVSSFINKFDKLSPEDLLYNDPLQHNRTTDSDGPDFEMMRNRFHDLLGRTEIHSSTEVSNAPLLNLATNVPAISTHTTSNMNDECTGSEPKNLLASSVGKASERIAPHITDGLLDNSKNCALSDQVHLPANSIDKTTRSLHLLGEDITSIPLMNHFHISPFHINVTHDDILQYIADNANIDKKQIKILRLTKNGQDISQLRHVNFKIETNDEISKIVLQSNFWPDRIKIKPWISKSRSAPTISFLGNTLT